jgi:hypothetical protein
MDSYAKGTGLAFLFVIIGFAGVALWYLWKNDFARETLEAVFPALGAILLSFYLGYKTAFIDRPPPKRFGAIVAILHDAAKGSVSGMHPMYRNVEIIVRHPSMFSEFDGVRRIDSIPSGDILIEEQLRDTANPPWTRADEMIADILQFAVCEWLRDNPQNWLGAEPMGPTIEIIPGAGKRSGGSKPKDSEWIRISSTDNPLLVARPVSLLLPHGSRARAEGNHEERLLFIETRHSKVTLRISPRGWQGLADTIDPDGQRLYAALKLPADRSNLDINIFELEVVADQGSFARFSEQAKVEAKWFPRLERNLDDAFSWERVRAAYMHE